MEEANKSDLFKVTDEEKADYENFLKQQESDLMKQIDNFAEISQQQQKIEEDE